MAEDSRTISKWGDETFGPANSHALAIRAREELNELIEAIAGGEIRDDIILEAADVTILLHRLVGSLGQELSDAVDKKMDINRKRQWVKSGDGTGQHK